MPRFIFLLAIICLIVLSMLDQGERSMEAEPEDVVSLVTVLQGLRLRAMALPALCLPI